VCVCLCVFVCVCVCVRERVINCIWQALTEHLFSIDKQVAFLQLNNRFTFRSEMLLNKLQSRSVCTGSSRSTQHIVASLPSHPASRRSLGLGLASLGLASQGLFLSGQATAAGEH